MSEAQRKKLAEIMIEIRESSDDKDAACDAIYHMMCCVFDDGKLPF